MNKPTAVIDKTIFQRICAEEISKCDFYWDTLYGRYQLVVPFVLIEEVLVNVVRPGKLDPLLIEQMRKQLAKMKPCWIDDVFEIVFREVVHKQPAVKFAAPSDKCLDRIFGLNRGDSELVRWVEQRKLLKRETTAQWKAAQVKLAPTDKPVQVDSEKAFFEKIILPEFAEIMDDSSKRREFLETILGKPFRRLHPAEEQKIDEAFENFTQQTFSDFPRTSETLITRLCYFLAPTAIIDLPTDKQRRKILKVSNQMNNLEDEQYVISALMGEALLTGDAGMRNIMKVFQEVGRWKGKVVFFDRNVDLSHQIPQLLD